MKAHITKEAIISEVRRLGLPLEEQAAYFKVERLPYVVHFAKSLRVRRIHLKGFEDISHPAIRRMSAEEAKKKRLGNVSAELDSTQPESVFRDGVLTCLRVMAGGGDVSDARGDELVQMTISVDRGLVEQIDSVVTRIPVPAGIQVTRDDTVRYLLHQALENRVWEQRETRRDAHPVDLKQHLQAIPDVGADEDFTPRRSVARRVDL